MSNEDTLAVGFATRFRNKSTQSKQKLLHMHTLTVGQPPRSCVTHPAPRDQVRTAISVLCGAHAIFLLVKAAAVAVTAPGDTWPQPRQPVEPQSPDTAGDSSGSVTGSGGGAGYGGGGEAEGFSGLYPYSYTADGGYVAWVGLAYMYISIGGLLVGLGGSWGWVCLELPVC